MPCGMTAACARASAYERERGLQGSGAKPPTAYLKA